jgi:lantibiotic modifying enzyme
LHGDDARSAWRAIDGIAASLSQNEVDVSLNTGSAGHALFFTYLDRARPNADYAARAQAALETTFAGVATLSAQPELYSGFTGVAWTVDHLLAPAEGDDDPNAELDELLFELVDRWAGNYDLVTGLCGFGLYALHRKSRASAAAIVARVVDQLAAHAIPATVGKRLRTRPEWLPEWRRARYPDGLHDLGLAHGAPGAALVLAGAATIVGERARQLSAEIARFVLTPRLAPDAASVLAESAEDARPARSAWCNGDPGAAAALLVAARALHDDRLEHAAMGLARHAAQRRGDVGVRDGGLCHGSAGLALIFHQLHHATGDSLFADVAQRWYQKTLLMRRDDVLGGFASFWPDGDHQSLFRDDPSVVSGRVGIGLALLSAVAPIAPRWASVLGIAPF